MCDIAFESHALMPWQMTWNGRTWRDMPGSEEMTKKCNFALWRRGLLESEESPDENDVVESGVRRLVPMHKGNGGARRRRPRVDEERVARVAEMEEKRRAEAELRRVQGQLQMRLTQWTQAIGAMEQIAKRANVDSGTLSKIRMTGRGMAGARVERVLAVLDELDAGDWVLTPRPSQPVKVPVVCPPGHVPFKAWLEAMGKHMGMQPHSVRVRALRGALALPKIIKLHSRAWFVHKSALPKTERRTAA